MLLGQDVDSLLSPPFSTARKHPLPSSRHIVPAHNGSALPFDGCGRLRKIVETSWKVFSLGNGVPCSLDSKCQTSINSGGWAGLAINLGGVIVSCVIG